ncbi:4a-hydroxytetrahydrobiopterin dehydratase [Patescibacteria group bacterium]|nr:4a-hydroxytetrahydrobiopterin dehydratase [Patescibacteria group bacterium]
MDLTKKHCVPCEGGIPPFTQRKARQYLKNAQGWELVDDDKKIEKEFTFKNFVEAIDFVNNVAEIAEREDHHPDLFIHAYKKLRITLSTHAIGGLSENDFILAAKIDALEAR